MRGPISPRPTHPPVFASMQFDSHCLCVSSGLLTLWPANAANAHSPLVDLRIDSGTPSSDLSCCGSSVRFMKSREWSALPNIMAIWLAPPRARVTFTPLAAFPDLSRRPLGFDRQPTSPCKPSPPGYSTLWDSGSILAIHDHLVGRLHYTTVDPAQPIFPVGVLDLNAPPRSGTRRMGQ